MNQFVKLALTILLALFAFVAGMMYCEREYNIESFSDNIYLTKSNQDTGFIEFLERNDDNVVFINGYLDASVSTEENGIVQEQCEIDIDELIARSGHQRIFPIPRYGNLDELRCYETGLVLDLNEEAIYQPSFGGTGIVMIRFKGFFEVFSTYHSGPSIHYHLKAVSVPFNIRYSK
ncbi:hypothetical protein P7F88_18905 [Vibrio hannami]|uniref:hypothetical protein n=1 Tax=Vibrio hannami TaxID=2717094 RepID=UPI00240F49D0|nr:hypothetical protein [Vibrio hannami]MDG3088034.1 hypothetical protein [Vibrio hannami]